VWPGLNVILEIILPPSRWDSIPFRWNGSRCFYSVMLAFPPCSRRRFSNCGLSDKGSFYLSHRAHGSLRGRDRLVARPMMAFSNCGLSDKGSFYLSHRAHGSLRGRDRLVARPMMASVAGCLPRSAARSEISVARPGSLIAASPTRARFICLTGLMVLSGVGTAWWPAP
jgi:hypothetical protein